MSDGWRRALSELALLGGAIVLAVMEPPSADRSEFASVPRGDGAPALLLPKTPGSIRFAVLGDVGRGDALQYATAAELTRWHERFPFEFVLLLGDNIYGPGTPEDLARRFDVPYRELLERGVAFHAVPGNHDPPAILHHPPLGMRGRRYYAFDESAGLPLIGTRATFFAIDTVTLDWPQLEWLERAVQTSKTDWKIAFYHHPLYTSGQYALSARRTRWWLESLFVNGGVDVGFSGHEHFYERIVPQQGVQYFTSGAGGALRRGALRRSPSLAVGFDGDTHFLLIEIAGDALHFQAISRTGHTVDSGTIARDPEKRKPPALRQ